MQQHQLELQQQQQSHGMPNDSAMSSTPWEMNSGGGPTNAAAVAAQQQQHLAPLKPSSPRAIAAEDSQVCCSSNFVARVWICTILRAIAIEDSQV